MWPERSQEGRGEAGVHAGKHVGSTALGWGAAGEVQQGEALKESKVFGVFFLVVFNLLWH